MQGTKVTLETIGRLTQGESNMLRFIMIFIFTVTLLTGLVNLFHPIQITDGVMGVVLFL
jgi:hypothetical protein